MCAESLGGSHANSLIGGSVSLSSYEFRLVDYVELCSVLEPSGSHNLSSPSSTGFLERHLIFGLGFCISSFFKFIDLIANIKSNVNNLLLVIK